MKLKPKTEQVIDLQAWDKLVSATYNRPYSFQQQDDCKGRGSHYFTVPAPESEEDAEMHEEVPEKVNDPKMGVKFKVWLERDPEQPLSGESDGQLEYVRRLWWHRNFYPDFQTVANDLHAKGLIDAGDYRIIIDW